MKRVYCLVGVIKMVVIYRMGLNPMQAVTSKGKLKANKTRKHRIEERDILTLNSTLI